MRGQKSWSEFIRSLTQECEFHAPATAAEITDAESTLGVRLPSELKELLQESNGVSGPYGTGLIWNIERIQQDNLHFRRNPVFDDLYMPFEPLLFFADAGNGDQLAFVILRGEIRNPDIFLWEHETDSRRWAAGRLDIYMEKALSGELAI